MSADRSRKPARSALPDDPVVAEVRRIRARMLKKAGGTLEGLRRYVAALEAKRLEAARTAKPKPTRSRRRSTA